MTSAMSSGSNSLNPTIRGLLAWVSALPHAGHCVKKSAASGVKRRRQIWQQWLVTRVSVAFLLLRRGSRPVSGRSTWLA